MAALLIVRAIVPEADRTAFDSWYETEHLPQAKAAFNALSARRGWSEQDPGVHIALYEFETLAQASEIADSAQISQLIAEFDRMWENRVTRTREVLNLKQSIGLS